MRSLVAGLVAGIVGVIVAVLTVAAAMRISAATESCDTTKHICDVGPMAGFGLGILLAPITGIFGVVVSARRLTRKTAESQN